MGCPLGFLTGTPRCRPRYRQVTIDATGLASRCDTLWSSEPWKMSSDRYLQLIAIEILIYYLD